MTVTIRQAKSADAAVVGELAFALVCELAPEVADSISLDHYRATAATLLDEGQNYWALIASSSDDRVLGLLTLTETASVYAGGRFGQIMELYVEPDHRSAGVAAELVRAAVDVARDKDWRRLEVGAPDVPRWQRTVNFYLKEGFVEIGPRLKYLL